MVTISDIAAALGVTPSTVSRALSGSPRVKEETRLAVEQMAAEMGYERNIVAANLRKGKSDIVDVIVPRIHREFFSNVIGGAESILNAAGYSVLICQTHEEFDAEVKALRTMRNNQVAGVLMSHAIGAMDGTHVVDTLGDSIPLVQFDRVFSDLPGAKVVSNNFQGAYEATKHLVEQGYRRIGTLAGYMNSEAYAARLDGYRKALEDSGLPIDESIVFYDTIVRETGFEGGLKALDAGCDALYCTGDFCALGAIEAVRSKGLRIPEDFGIVGTANESFTALMTPTISSLALNPFEMGRQAALAFLSGEGETVVVPMELKVRDSSNRNRQLNLTHICPK
ncbi:MAG: LacI family DNA-binding transcriptional regulator [Bacteroidales bacterium]|nr:LacI family DNA-binding transcriptional regulator [Bacteroidales bacterium]